MGKSQGVFLGLLQSYCRCLVDLISVPVSRVHLAILKDAAQGPADLSCAVVNEKKFLI